MQADASICQLTERVKELLLCPESAADELLLSRIFDCLKYKGSTIKVNVLVKDSKKETVYLELIWASSGKNRKKGK